MRTTWYIFLIIKGSCIINGTEQLCKCNIGWSGDLCDIKTCDDVLICQKTPQSENDLEKCKIENHDRKCDCRDSVVGHKCHTKICTSTDIKNCGKHGKYFKI